MTDSTHQAPSNLMNLPWDLRRQILKDMLIFEETAVTTHTWIARTDRHDWLQSPSKRLIEGHRSPIEMLDDGSRTNVVANLKASLLGCCKQLYREGMYMLYRENKFITLEGLGINDNDGLFNKRAIMALMEPFGKIPHWDLKMDDRQRSPEVPSRPEVKIIARISVVCPKPRQKGATMVFPARFFSNICESLCLLPRLSNPENQQQIFVPRMHLSFDFGIFPQLLIMPSSSSQPFGELLGRHISRTFGKSIEQLDFGLQSSACGTKRCCNYAERFLARDLELRWGETAKQGLQRALREIVNDLQLGEGLATKDERGQFRAHFFTLRRTIFRVATERRWSHLIASRLDEQLGMVARWCSFRAASQDIDREPRRLDTDWNRNRTIDNSEIYWVGLPLYRFALQPVPSSSDLPVSSSLDQPQHRSRIFLRLAELSCMLGGPDLEVATYLLFAAIELKLADMHKWSDVVEINSTLLQKVIDFLFFSGQDVPSKPKLCASCVRMATNRRLEHFEKHLRSTLRTDKLDRRMILQKLYFIRFYVRVRFGRIAKCPFDPEDILDPGLLAGE